MYYDSESGLLKLTCFVLKYFMIGLFGFALLSVLLGFLYDLELAILLWEICFPWLARLALAIGGLIALLTVVESI